MVVWGCWHRGRAEGRSKELVAQNNGKSSVYLMGRNHAILSSTVGLLPRCRASVRAGSALTPTLTRPGSPLEKEELIPRLCRSQGASCFRYNSARRDSRCTRDIRSKSGFLDIPRRVYETTRHHHDVQK